MSDRSGHFYKCVRSWDYKPMDALRLVYGPKPLRAAQDLDFTRMFGRNGRHHPHVADMAWHAVATAERLSHDGGIDYRALLGLPTTIAGTFTVSI